MPAPPTSHTVNAHGLRLHYLDWGNDDLPPMLLLHGLQDCAGLWRSFAEGVRDSYHVVALDHRGHGDSPRATSYALEDYVREVGGVIDALGLRNVVLIGHSAGGKNAFIYTAEHPGDVAKLVITDMDPDAYNPGSVAMISRYKGEADEYDGLAGVVERLRSRQPGSTEEVLRANAVDLTTPAADGRLQWKRHRDVVTQYDRPDAWAYLPRIGAPTLIVRGADSTLLTRDVAETYAADDSRLPSRRDSGRGPLGAPRAPGPLPAHRSRVPGRRPRVTGTTPVAVDGAPERR